jgi:peptide/nickel transport system permease protein
MGVEQSFERLLRSPSAVLAGLVTLILVSAGLLAPWIAPHNPFDLGSLRLTDAFTPPAWSDQGDGAYPLGTDDQGRDMLSAILYGLRISLVVGFSSVLLAALIGIALGVAAGYLGGWIDGVIMRLADIQLSFPPLLIALLIDGVARTALPRDLHASISVHVVILAIGLSFWVQYARTVRGLTLVECQKDYINAARLIGVHPVRIVFGHILPNVMGPVLVITTINLALAIITEATLSFLGLGVPPTQSSLGTLIRIGNDFLFSGEWWIAVFPAVTLATLVLAVNLLGDWLRDTLNPKLRSQRF